MFRVFFTILLSILGSSIVDSINPINKLTRDEIVPRVVNGWPAKLGDVPYQVAFRAKIYSSLYGTFCGGTIIGPSKLLSAAHCFNDDKSSCRRLCGGHGSITRVTHLFAVAGNLRNRDYYSYYDTAERGQWRRLIRVIYPRHYKFPDYDIAVVRIAHPFLYNSNVQAIPIAVRNVDYHGQCLVSGYGRTSETTSSSQLLLAHLDLVPIDTCNRRFRKNMEKFVCTSSKLTDVGKGDSGGPLVCASTGDPNDEGKGVLIGVVSGHKYHVGSFFTRVSYFSKFVGRNNCSVKLLNSFLFLFVIYTTFLLF